MNKRLGISLLASISLILLIVVSPSIQASAEKPNKVDVLIGFNGKPQEALIRAFGGEISHNFDPFISVISASIPESAINALSKNPNISIIEPDATVTILDHSSGSPSAEYPWGVVHHRADELHDGVSPNLGASVSVAVIDTGIAPHADLPTVTGWKDFVGSSAVAYDDNGHGTHVSGTIAGVMNGVGVVGIAPGVDLYGAKVLNSAGNGLYSDVIAAIKWAVSNDVDIISMSLGGSVGSTALESAINEAHNAGTLIIAAAGNSGNCGGKGDNVSYPARYANAVAVAAVGQDNSRPCFSSTGSQVELSAAGVGIYSTVPGGYTTASGTSMATPHVSGIAALVLSANDWTNDQVRDALRNTAIDLGKNGKDSKYGWGLADAVSAVNYDPSNTDPTPDPDPSDPTNCPKGKQKKGLC